MQISELRDRLRSRLLDFAWGEWAQMGLLAQPTRTSPWAEDPEALLLLTLEVGRHDPRLFDETLDWLVANGRLVSQQRLRNLCRDDEERSLADAALAWAAQHQRALRAAGKHPPSGDTARRQLFPEAPAGERVDPVFASHGWSKAPTAPSGKSLPPPLDAPINLAFRLRRLFGVGSRAEILRFLLTSRTSGAQAEVVRRAAGYAKRNVLDAANELVAAGAIAAYTLGASGERFYHADLNAWRSFLDLEEMPVHRDWPQLLGALRVLHRELADSRWDDLSDYLRASEGRQLMLAVEADLLYAGVRLRGAGTGADYWSSFVTDVEEATAGLGTSSSPPSGSRTGARSSRRAN